MPFASIALIGGGLSLIGGLIGSDASRSAANTQADASRNATAAQLQMFNTQNNQQAPYRQAGYSSLAAMLKGLGLGGGQFDANGNAAAAPGAPTRDQFTTNIAATPGNPGHYQGDRGGTLVGGTPGTPASTSFNQAGYDQALANWNSTQGAPGTSMSQTGASPISDGQFTHQFNAGDLNANLAPNYQFQLDQGLGAVKNASNMQTGLLSGNTLKGVNDYAQNYAGGAYQQAYNNYNANQTNIFNRLSNIAGLGQTANQSTGQLAGQTAQGVAGTIQNAGAAQAAGTVGQANALTGGANNALGWYSLSQMMKQ